MGINKNHEFEDLEGVKCAIVEKNATPARAEFLKNLLELNKYTVVIVKSPPPKAAVTPDPNSAPPIIPETFTVGVTDVTFNMINAVTSAAYFTHRMDTLSHLNIGNKRTP